MMLYVVYQIPGVKPLLNSQHRAQELRDEVKQVLAIMEANEAAKKEKEKEQKELQESPSQPNSRKFSLSRTSREQSPSQSVEKDKSDDSKKVNGTEKNETSVSRNSTSRSRSNIDDI